MKDHRQRGGDDISSGGSTRTASVAPGKATLTAALPVQRMTPKTTQEAVGQPGREDAPPVRRESSGDEANASPPITSPIAASDTSERKLPRLQLKSIISMVPSGTIDAGRVQPVQRKANGGAPSAGAPTQTASDGVAGTGGPLPHSAQIQASFGHHDVSAVQAHQGPAARDATRTLGAEAYAFGNSVAFGSSPDLHTAAHEAAHVVQQRGGVQLKGGIDQPGDTYERHADAVADRVVTGKSAAPLLDRLPGTGSIGGPTNIQRMPAPSAGSGPAADTRNPELSAASSGASAATAVATNAADARSTATAAGPTGDPLALPAHTHADDVARAESIYETAQSTGNGILSSLVPGYLAARDQLDATAVAELGGRMIGAFTVVHGAKPALDQMIKTLPHRSVQGGAGDELALARRQQTVEAKAPLLVPLIQSVDALVASAITPHVFQGREVAGQVVVVSLDGPASQRTAKLTGELERTVGMLLLVSELKAQLLDTKKGLDRTALGVARGKLRRWASRPLDLAFLRAALGGFWDVLDATASGPNETKPSDVLGDATKQAKHTGWLGDVGQVDVTTVCNELRSRSRDGAEFAIRQLYTADPDARAKLLIQIKERGMLDALCSSVGWADVKELHDSLGFGFAEIKTDLQHYFLGKRKYGPDLGHEWENHDSSLHALVARLGGAGSVLNFALDVGTFGFNSSYGKALDDNSQGLTSDAEASRAKMHAAGKTAAIAAVSMLTGGLADKFVRGGAAAVSTARAIGAGAAGGSAGAVGALAASDAYSNVSGDQRGFSSAEDYVKAALLGGAIGGAVGGVTQGISNRVAKQYLPKAGELPARAGAPGTELPKPPAGHKPKLGTTDDVARDAVPQAAHDEHAPTLDDAERHELVAKGATPRDLAAAEGLVAMNPPEARRLIRDYGDDLLEQLRTQPLRSLAELETRLARQRSQVKNLVKGLYESTDEPPAGWRLDTTTPTPEADGTRVVRTEVYGPNGAKGLFKRAYNPATRTLELREAFLKLSGQDVPLPNLIPKQGSSPEMIAGKGTPTVQYITLHQMRWLGVPAGDAGGAGVRQVHLSDIQNVETIVHLHYLRTTQGGDLSDLVAFTPSVRYAETTAIQAGYQRVGEPLLTGGSNRPIRELLEFQEQASPKRRVENDEILARYQFTRDTVMRMGFDIDFPVGAASGALDGGRPASEHAPNAASAGAPPAVSSTAEERKP